MAAGVLSISLDFEMAWGSRRSSNPDHALGVERVREVVHALLDLFVRHNISATWATVGHLMLRSEDCAEGRFPPQLLAPQPEWFRGHWYDGIPTYDAPQACRFYAPDLVEAIVQCPVHQELASHTFSHVVIGESACTAEIAEAEFAMVRKLGQGLGREIQSLVFPRNHVGHLDVLRQTGHRCFRGTNTEWYLRGLPVSDQSPGFIQKQVIRALRFFDEVFCMAPSVGHARRVEGLWELPYGMFFSGHAGMSRWLSPEHLVRKALKGLRKATRKNRVFSLYTHPHNFLPDPAPILAAFEDICRAANQLRESGMLEIKTMEEIADDLEHGRNLHWVDRETLASRCADGWLNEFSIHPQSVGPRGRLVGGCSTARITPSGTAAALASQSETGLDVLGRPLAAGALHEVQTEAGCRTND